MADEITISVENVGPPLADVPHQLPNSQALRGRGLAIVSMLSGTVHANHEYGRTRVSAVRDVSTAGRQ